MDISDYVKILKQNYNLVLTGAPGTGKTYLAKQIATQLILGKNKCENEEDEKCFKAQCKFVQFHPSYDYTDFVEGLRPVKIDKEIGFERKDGVFKEFCKEAIKNCVAEEGIIEHAWNELISDIDAHRATADYFVYSEKGQQKGPLFIENGREEKRIKWEKQDGKPSTRSTSMSPRGEYYAVEDFSFDKLQKYYNELGLTNLNALPKSTELRDMKAKDENGKENSPGGSTAFNLAILQDILSRMINATHIKRKFVFIIDEINRGELSKIFGELFFSIDPGYRGESGSVQTQYQNLIEDDDIFKEGFYVSENVYIIGTMNDIDRSVESMDFAIRRRFAWVEVRAEENVGMLNQLDDSIKEEAILRMKNLNSAIDNVEGLSSAYHIGASYFLKLNQYEIDKFESLWKYHLKGVLFEYLRGLENATEELEKLKKAYNISIEKSDINESAQAER